MYSSALAVIVSQPGSLVKLTVVDPGTEEPGWGKFDNTGCTPRGKEAGEGANLGRIAVWGPESHAAVPVSQGLFGAGLGSQTSGGVPASAWNGDRYLEITVGGETLSPCEPKSTTG